jgi:hypothetical protein
MTKFWIGGLIFLFSLTAGCGSKPSFNALNTSAAQTASNQGASSKGGGKGSGGTDPSSSGTCDEDEVLVCKIDSDGSKEQECVDSEELSQLGLDASKPNQTGKNGSHLGAC